MWVHFNMYLIKQNAHGGLLLPCGISGVSPGGCVLSGISDHLVRSCSQAAEKGPGSCCVTSLPKDCDSEDLRVNRENLHSATLRQGSSSRNFAFPSFDVSGQRVGRSSAPPGGQKELQAPSFVSRQYTWPRGTGVTLGTWPSVSLQDPGWGLAKK